MRITLLVQGQAGIAGYCFGLCRERDWLLRRLKSAPLRLSHPLAAEALASPTLARSYFVAAFCSLCLCMQASLRIGIKNKKMSFDIFLLRLVLRRERDSNPRNSCPFTAFRVRPDRPLRHLSFSIPVVSECKYSNYFTKSYIFRKKTKKILFFSCFLPPNPLSRGLRRRNPDKTPCIRRLPKYHPKREPE